MNLDTIRNAVHETETVIDGAIAFIGDIAQKLRDALSGGNTEAELSALADELDGKKSALAAALVANTVAAEEDPILGEDTVAGDDTGTDTTTGGGDDDTLTGGLGEDTVAGA